MKMRKAGSWTKEIRKESMDQDPLVSIITVTFNASLHLKQAIESILNQSYRNIELIVIDGGSTDSTLDIIEGFGEAICYWQSEPDLGIYDAMNKGLALARGEWVGFKNADDWYAPDAILQLVKAIRTSEADVWYGNSYSVIQESPLVVSPFFTDHNYLGQHRGIDHRSSFVRTSLHQQFPFDLKYKLASDLDVFWRLEAFGARFAHIDHFLAYKRFGGASDGTRILKETFEINRIHKGLVFAIKARLKGLIKFIIWQSSNFLLRNFLGKTLYNKFKSRNLNR